MSESGRPRTFTVLLFVLKISRFTGSVVFLQCFRPPLDNLTCEELINCNTSSGILSSLRFLWFRDDFRLYEYRRYPPLDFSFLGGSTFPFHLFLVTRMTSHCHETFFLTGFDSVPLGFSEYRQFKPFLGSSWLPRVSRVFEVGTGRNPKVVSCKPILTVIPLFLTWRINYAHYDCRVSHLKDCGYSYTNPTYLSILTNPPPPTLGIGRSTRYSITIID